MTTEVLENPVALTSEYFNPEKAQELRDLFVIMEERRLQKEHLEKVTAAFRTRYSDVLHDRLNYDLLIKEIGQLHTASKYADSDVISVKTKNQSIGEKHQQTAKYNQLSYDLFCHRLITMSVSDLTSDLMPVFEAEADARKLEPDDRRETLATIKSNLAVAVEEFTRFKPKFNFRNIDNRKKFIPDVNKRGWLHSRSMAIQFGTTESAEKWKHFSYTKIGDGIEKILAEKIEFFTPVQVGEILDKAGY